MEFKGLSLKDILDKNWSRKAEMLLISCACLVAVSYLTQGSPMWVTVIGQLGTCALGLAAIAAQCCIDIKHPRDVGPVDWKKIVGRLLQREALLKITVPGTTEELPADEPAATQSEVVP